MSGEALSDLELIRLAVLDLDELESPTRPAGRIREALQRARELYFELERLKPADPSARACAGCGGPLPPDRGRRPRKWCSERCRDVARKSPGKGR